jgi:tubulin-specific chaperone D
MERLRAHTLNMGNNWAVPYLMLLWLSLICRIPFDLSNFDSTEANSGGMAQRIESIGREYLNKSGLDKDGAALLLSKLYTRSVSVGKLNQISNCG